MLDGRWRPGVEQGLRSTGSRLAKSGLSPDHVTLLGLLTSCLAAGLAATGHLVWATAALALSGLLDVLDGAVAKGGGKASVRGAFFDSVSDRVSDSAVLGGVAWHLAGTGERLPFLAFAVLGFSFLISYERARAESLGLDARGGLMERAERMVLLGIGMSFGVLVPVLWVMAVLTGLTALQRFAKVWKLASQPVNRAITEVAGDPHARRVRWSPVRRIELVESRWRERKDRSSGARPRRSWPRAQRVSRSPRGWRSSWDGARWRERRRQQRTRP